MYTIFMIILFVTSLWSPVSGAASGTDEAQNPVALGLQAYQNAQNKEAFELFSLAFSQNLDPQASYFLAEMYAAGIGCNQSLTLALVYARYAEHCGLQEAKELLDRICSELFLKIHLWSAVKTLTQFCGDPQTQVPAIGVSF